MLVHLLIEPGGESMAAPPGCGPCGGYQDQEEDIDLEVAVLVVILKHKRKLDPIHDMSNLNFLPDLWIYSW